MRSFCKMRRRKFGIRNRKLPRISRWCEMPLPPEKRTPPNSAALCAPPLAIVESQMPDHCTVTRFCGLRSLAGKLWPKRQEIRQSRFMFCSTFVIPDFSRLSPRSLPEVRKRRGDFCGSAAARDSTDGVGNGRPLLEPALFRDDPLSSSSSRRFALTFTATPRHPWYPLRPNSPGSQTAWGAGLIQNAGCLATSASIPRERLQPFESS